MNFNHEELMLMMLYNSGTRLGLIHELRLMQCYLMPDETALRELSEGVIEKLKLLTDAAIDHVRNILCFVKSLWYKERQKCCDNNYQKDNNVGVRHLKSLVKRL